MEAIDGWLGAAGAENVDGYRDLLVKALNPTSAEREALVLPEPQSADANAVLALLKKGQVPTQRAVQAGAANARPPVVRQPARKWSDAEIDHFGQLGAPWLHEYRQTHGTGPTWNEFFSSAPVERAFDEFGVGSGVGEGGVQGYLRRDGVRSLLIRRGRRRGWFAFNDQPRSLCAGPSFFVAGYRAPDPVGRRVAGLIRQSHAAGGKRLQWADIAEVLDLDGSRVFRDVEDAAAQAGWLATEQWISIKPAGIGLGFRARREQRRNGLRSARKRLIDQSPASEPVSTD